MELELEQLERQRQEVRRNMDEIDRKLEQVIRIRMDSSVGKDCHQVNILKPVCIKGSPRMQEADRELEGPPGLPRPQQHRTTVEGHRPT